MLSKNCEKKKKERDELQNGNTMSIRNTEALIYAYIGFEEAPAAKTSEGVNCFFLITFIKKAIS